MTSANPAKPNLLQPSQLAAIEDLSFLARSVVDGFLDGIHTHPIPRQGTAFRQYRPYFPGDDPRLLDWKMFARSDRYYVRETETESNVAVRFILDASNSMNHLSNDGLSKFRYAQMAIACMAYLAARQGDAVFGVALSEGTPQVFPKGRSGIGAFTEELDALQPEGKLPHWPVWSRLIGPYHQRELVVVITDFYDADQELQRALGHMAAMGREVMAIHLTTKKEASLEYRGTVLFEDLESGETVLVPTRHIRKRYQDAFQAMGEQLKSNFSSLGIEYQEWQIEEPLDQALRTFFMKRMLMV